MKKDIAQLLFLCGLIFTACTSRTAIVPETATPINIPIAETSTPLPVPTETGLPSVTPLPTATAEPPNPTEKPTETLEPTSTPPAPGTLVTIRELVDFQHVFNQHVGSRRLILFMATGCPSCLSAGRWIEDQILAKNPGLDIQVFVVWLTTADVGGGRWQEDLLTDSRVIHFYEPAQQVSLPFASLPIDGPERSSLERTYGRLSWGVNAVWDAYYYFGEDEVWNGEMPPLPVQAGQPLMAERRTIEGLFVSELAEVAPELDGTSPIDFQIIAAESLVSYGVGETFAGQSFNYAIGVTDVMSGNLQIDLANPAASAVSPITVNIREFQSDNILRDERIRSAHLASASFPLAVFTPNELIGLPDSYTVGETLQFEISGDLVVREISVPTTFQVEAMIDGDTLSGTARTQVLMTDFGIDPPVIANLITTENEVDIVFEFVARPHGQ